MEEFMNDSMEHQTKVWLVIDKEATHFSKLLEVNWCAKLIHELSLPIFNKRKFAPQPFGRTCQNTLWSLTMQAYVNVIELHTSSSSISESLWFISNTICIIRLLKYISIITNCGRSSREAAETEYFQKHKKILHIKWKTWPRQDISLFHSKALTSTSRLCEVSCLSFSRILVGFSGMFQFLDKWYTTWKTE